ncbi:helix-turn-helix domain-containing protein [Amycolatopsis rubida]|uniref:Transcriptional regulator, contains XRE-family HTH domain n=1 Tax=Amycolatopsis rubida TaxID=112413 RepID=A0A1I5X7E5_9PSEU|nr:helix-turn-helix transcriptional regulator [Amycolatopsis rubida]SFQ27746.1 Transcriptional regulator, contains XRE-family HTH domain [Amycolatopsis rubida]
MPESNLLGERLRKLREWRELDLRTTADLAGISFGYLGQIERGDKPVNSRHLLERFARALWVSPADLTDQPWEPADPISNEARTALLKVEIALEEHELGHDPGVAVRPWPEIAEDVRKLLDLMHVQSDYLGQATMLPDLLAELHAAHCRDSGHRAEILRALIRAYTSATWTTKRLNGRGLPAIAAGHAQDVAEKLGEPAWTGFAAWLRGDATGQLSRPKQYDKSVEAADALVGHLDDQDALQIYGMLHLSAALAKAAQESRTDAETHLDEAQAAADRLDVEVGRFAHLWFGRPNVGIWRASLGAEFGDGPKVAEIARTVRADLIPSPSRRAEFWADVGRSLLDVQHSASRDRKVDAARRDRGIAALFTAEKLAPQRIRHDPLVRETVSAELHRARRSPDGRDLRNLRGMAWRMGLHPIG